MKTTIYPSEAVPAALYKSSSFRVIQSDTFVLCLFLHDFAVAGFSCSCFFGSQDIAFGGFRNDGFGWRTQWVRQVQCSAVRSASCKIDQYRTQRKSWKMRPDLMHSGNIWNAFDKCLIMSGVVCVCFLASHEQVRK